MRIVFIGAVAFSRVMLEKLLLLEADIAGVITKSGSAYNADFDDISDLAIKENIPFKHVRNINHENNIKWVKEIAPDVIFCFGWSNLLQNEFLSIAPMGVVGYHPSLLPQNKGRHPLIWAKVLGLPATGSTFFFMDEGADTGDILSQQSFTIGFEDDAASLYRKMTDTALSQVETFLPLLIGKTYKRIPQEKNAGNEWRKRGMRDGLIDFRMGTDSICNQVRALTRPYVGAHCFFKEKEIKIWSVVPGNCDANNYEPGKVLSVENNVIEIKTGNGSVKITEHGFAEMPQVNQYII